MTDVPVYVRKTDMPAQLNLGNKISFIFSPAKIVPASISWLRRRVVRPDQKKGTDLFFARILANA